MACTSVVVRRMDKRDRVLGWSIKCKGDCPGGAPCRTHDRGDPENIGQILRFCACPADIPVPQPDPSTRANMVNGCRVALRLKRNNQGQLKPFDYSCIGACEDAEHTECLAVIAEVVPFADGDRRNELLECRCVDRVEPVSFGGGELLALARRNRAAAKRPRTAAKRTKRR